MDKKGVRKIGKEILFRILSLVIAFFISALAFKIGKSILIFLRAYFKDVTSINSFYNIAFGLFAIFVIIFFILSYRKTASIFLKDDKTLKNEGGYFEKLKSFFEKFGKNKIVNNLKIIFFLLVIILLLILVLNDLFVIS